MGPLASHHSLLLLLLLLITGSWLFASVPVCRAGRHEKRLLRRLFESDGDTRHNPMERPVANETDILYVWFKVSLQQIIDVDEKNQILFANIWLDLSWTDYHFVWNPAEYGNVQKINVDPKRVWKPDILLYNSADEKFDATYPTNVVIDHTGSMSFIPPGMFRSTCKIDITWFPFDTQVCKLKFGSWTYDGGTVDLRFKCNNESLSTTELRLNDPLNCSTKGEGDISTYIESGEWSLEGVPGVRHSNLYDCCPHPFIDLEFFLRIRRRKLYYIFNLIAPCSFLACLALLSFIIPPDAGEKVSFGVTILLSLTVFLMMVAEAMPPTSDAVPVIGMYFACTMIMCSLSVVFTVIVLNYHHRDAESHPVPNWVKKLICTYLAAVLFMRNPASTRESSSQQQQQHSSLASKVSFAMRRRRSREFGGYCGSGGGGGVGGGGPSGVGFELRERSSKSLLANVLDLEDDVRGGGGSGGGLGGLASGPPNYFQNYIGIGMPSPSNGFQQQQQQPPPPPQLHQCSTRSDLAAVINELRIITKKISDDIADGEISSEWKFAARVVDRLCLIMFSCFTVVSTCAILFSAPDVFKG